MFLSKYYTKLRNKIGNSKHIDSIWLKDVPLSEALTSIKKHFEEEYRVRFGKAKSKGLYSNDDWSRIEKCTQLIDRNAGSVLDVGVGPGALLNMLQLSGRYSRVTGIDIRHYSKLVKVTDELDIRIMSVDQMTFDDNEFDTVICMEVLEHITLEQFLRALDQLRRVAKSRLIMTVPFEEPLPLPSYHKLRFDLSDIQKYFPNGKYVLFKRHRGVPWMVIIENFSGVDQ